MKLLSIILCLLPLFFGCGAKKAAKSDKPSLLCTTGQVGDMVRAIGGAHFHVDVLMGPGVDPHLHRPVPRDNELMHNADAIFYNGLHLEGKMVEVLENYGKKKMTVAFGKIMEEKDPDRLRHPEEFKEGGTDPHVWFDAELWSLCVTPVVDALGSLQPEHREEFAAAGKKYREELLQVHKECKERLAKIPKDQRVLVTAHDAFGYYGKAYDIEVHGLQGISTVDQIAQKMQNDLIDLLVKRKIKAVFVESSINQAVMKNVIKGCADKGHAVVEGGMLYSDAMGETGSGAETYVGMMRANLDTIVKALE